MDHDAIPQKASAIQPLAELELRHPGNLDRLRTAVEGLLAALPGELPGSNVVALHPA